MGTGRRKTAVARVRLKAGSGTITINDRPLDEYFTIHTDREAVLAPLTATGNRDKVDLRITCTGGGNTGQSGACKLGIARAIKLFDSASEEALRQNSFLTRDGRMKERKHYGLRGARRGTQFSKR